MMIINFLVYYNYAWRGLLVKDGPVPVAISPSLSGLILTRSATTPGVIIMNSVENKLIEKEVLRFLYAYRGKVPNEKITITGMTFNGVTTEQDNGETKL